MSALLTAVNSDGPLLDLPWEPGPIRFLGTFGTLPMTCTPAVGAIATAAINAASAVGALTGNPDSPPLDPDDPANNPVPGY